MTDTRTDGELIAAWRAGEAIAGQALFARHFKAVYRFFETKCAAEADELVQSTFLACVRARDQFRGDSSFKTYLFTIARHELYRALTARQRSAALLDFELSSIAQLAPTPGTQLAGHEERRRLLHSLRELPVDTQMLLELHYWEGISIGDLADVFGVPQVTIRSRLHRARTALREQMMREPDATRLIGHTLESLDAWARQLADQS